MAGQRTQRRPGPRRAAARDLPPGGRGGAGDGELEALGKWLVLSQAKAYDRAVAAVEWDRFCHLLLDFAAWIEAGDWSGRADPEAAAALQAPIGKFAEPRLKRLRRQVRRDGRNLSELDPAARHELRIRAKKLRYATEFFGEAFGGGPGRRRGRFLSALKGFQDALGGLNDIDVAERVSAEAVRQAGARLAFQAGVLAGARKADEAALCRTAEKCFEAFDDARPFWA